MGSTLQTHTLYLHTDKGKWTHNIEKQRPCLMPSQHSLSSSSALFFSWLGNRARPPMSIPPSNPLHFNNSSVWAGGNLPSPRVFYQQHKHTTRCCLFRALAPIALFSGRINVWTISAAWWSVVCICETVKALTYWMVLKGDGLYLEVIEKAGHKHPLR